MRTSIGRRVGTVSALVCVSAVTLFSPARAYYYDNVAVPLASGRIVDDPGMVGTLTGWGTAGSLNIPESLEGVPVVSISMGSGWALASTLTGKVVTWGADGTIAPALPSSLDPATLAQLSAAGTSAAAALTWDGKVTTWLGGDTPGASAWLDGNQLTDIATIAVGQKKPYGVALTKDGTVKTWGVDSGSGNVTSDLPSTLSNVVGIAACDDTSLALTADGAVHGWGSDANGLVSGAPGPDTNKVVQIACAGTTGVARRMDGSLTEWGDTSGVDAIPASLSAALADGGTVNWIDASSEGIVAIGRTSDSRKQTWAWGGPTLGGAAVPSQAKGTYVSEFAPGSDGVYALTPAIFALRKPTITGTAAPGHTLTAEYAHLFTGHTAAQTGQWYRNGAPIEGTASAVNTSTVYRVTADDAGTVLTYRETTVDADHPDAPPVVAESDPITVGPADSASTVTLAIHSGSYGHSSSVTVRVASPAGASGPVSLSVDGASAGTATLSHGSASFRLPAKLAAGPHMVGATYEGNSTSAGATGWATLTVAKATSHTKVMVPKKARHGGKVKVTVKVRTSGGQATGTVTVKIGKAKGYGSVVHGKAVVRLKVAKVPHKQKVVAVYSGDNNVRGSRAHARLTVR